MVKLLVFGRRTVPVGGAHSAGGVAGSTPSSRRAEGEFRRDRERAGRGECRRSRTGAAQGSDSEPKRRTGERDQRRGLTRPGPRRPHWTSADGKKGEGLRIWRRAASPSAVRAHGYLALVMPVPH